MEKSFQFQLVLIASQTAKEKVSFERKEQKWEVEFKQLKERE